MKTGREDGIKDSGGIDFGAAQRAALTQGNLRGIIGKTAKRQLLCPIKTRSKQTGRARVERAPSFVRAGGVRYSRSKRRARTPRSVKVSASTRPRRSRTKWRM